MLNDAINIFAGLVVGLVTGYYFEWRTTKNTRMENAELHSKLRMLREGIYSVGRGAEQQAGPAQRGSLEDEVLRWVLAYQGPDGKISQARVVRRFLDEGFGTDQVRAALVKLDESGVIIVGDVIEVQ